MCGLLMFSGRVLGFDVGSSNVHDSADVGVCLSRLSMRGRRPSSCPHQKLPLHVFRSFVVLDDDDRHCCRIFRYRSSD